MKRIFILFTVVVLNGLVYAQNLTPDRRTDWTTEFFTISTDTTINIMNYGVSNDGSTNCSPAFNQILTDFPSESINIYFPPGIYLFNNQLNVRSSMICSGAGVDSTLLKFNGSGFNNFIQVYGSVGSVIDTLVSHYAKDDTYVIAPDVSSLQPGDFIKILEDDTGRITSAWSLNLLGQIVEVDTLIGNEIHFSTPLRMNFDAANHPRYLKLNMIHHVAIECLSIERTDSTIAQTRNIDFNAAAYCYVNGIKGELTNFGHVVMSNSYNVHVTNSYFKNAHAYGDGGQGYGVVIQLTSGNCLVQNNIFEHLRHSILLQACVNGNIIGYNYSRDPFWTSFPAAAAGDIVVHGNYPFMNLFEGNIVQNIYVDDSHGLNGPYNTFYRNRAELYGMNILNNSDNQNFIGNELPHPSLGFFNLAGTGHYLYGNNDEGVTVPLGTNTVTDTSLYLTAANPYYGLITSLPAIGYPNVLNEQKNIAQFNYENNYLASCNPQFLDTAITYGIETIEIENLVVYPNPADQIIFLNIKEVEDFIIYNSSGTICLSGIYTAGINVQNLPAGLYFIRLHNRHYKFVKV